MAESHHAIRPQPQLSLEQCPTLLITNIFWGSIIGDKIIGIPMHYKKRHYLHYFARPLILLILSCVGYTDER